MKRSFLLALAVAAMVLVGERHGSAANAGPTVMTIIGKVATANRGAYNEFSDSFFKYHEKTFEKAFAFDRESLKALPQATAAANAEGWPAPVQASGPRLKDVLTAAGVADTTTITAFALDGYGVEFTPAERAAHDWILAIDADGKPLGLGGRGPAWLLYDTGSGKASTDEEAKWIFSIFLMSAE